jgi:hypothetical protein
MPDKCFYSSPHREVFYPEESVLERIPFQVSRIPRRDEGLYPAFPPFWDCSLAEKKGNQI